MSQTLRQTDANYQIGALSLTIAVGATLKRWFAAYMMWRLEQLAVARLRYSATASCKRWELSGGRSRP